MLLLDDIILPEFGKEHEQLKDLLKFMLKIDPNVRPSATDCLKHPFFLDNAAVPAKEANPSVEVQGKDVRTISKSTEKTQISSTQFESPNH